MSRYATLARVTRLYRANPLMLLALRRYAAFARMYACVRAHACACVAIPRNGVTQVISTT